MPPKKPKPSYGESVALSDLDLTSAPPASLFDGQILRRSMGTDAAPKPEPPPVPDASLEFLNELTMRTMGQPSNPFAQVTTQVTTSQDTAAPGIPELPSNISFQPEPQPVPERRGPGRPPGPARGRSPGPDKLAPGTQAQNLSQDSKKKMLLKKKIRAYIRLHPELKDVIFMPQMEHPLEVWQATLEECRESLSEGLEASVLTQGIVYGTQAIEFMLPKLQRRFPAKAPMLNAYGFSKDIEVAAENPDSKLYKSIHICAIDLMGYVTCNPWFGLAVGVAGAFKERVTFNNKRAMEYAMEDAQERFVPNGKYSDL